MNRHFDRRRTSARLVGRSHPKVYKSDDEKEKEDEEIQAVSPPPRKRRPNSTRQDLNKKVIKTEEIFLSDDESPNEETEEAARVARIEQILKNFVSSHTANKNKKKVPDQNFQSESISKERNNDLNDMSVQEAIPSSLTSFFVHERIAMNETEKRIYQILDAVPSQRQIDADPKLHGPARRKPYTRLYDSTPSISSSTVPTATSSTTQYASQPQIQQRSPSPKINLAELSKRECPDTTSLPEKGIKLTSVPLKESSTKYKQIDGNEDKELVNELEKEVWMKEPEKLIEPEHECKMTEYMRKRIYDSKRQSRRAWQTTHDTLQKLREKELVIRDLKLQLVQQEQNFGSPDYLIGRSLKESKQFMSYTAMQPAARKNAQIVFCNLLRHAFPSFSNQDFKQIFSDTINDSFQKLPSKPVISSEIGKKLDQLEETIESRANDVRIIAEKSSEQRPHIKINPLRQSIKTFSPLAIVTNKPPLSTPVPGYQSQTVAQYLLGLPPTPLPINHQSNEDTDVTLTPAQLRERQILKLHPPIQYASPAERTRVLNKTLLISRKGDGKDSNESTTTTRIIAPTLIRKVPTITKRLQTSPSTIGSRQNALEFAIQQKSQKSTTSQQASSQSVQASKQQTPGVSAWRSVVMGRGSNSRDILMRMTRDATEQAQQENLRRLEALFPIKQEPEDSN